MESEGLSPSEEGAATSNSFRGPANPEFAGVAATDEVCRFKSCTAHQCGEVPRICCSGDLATLVYGRMNPATLGGMWGSRLAYVAGPASPGNSPAWQRSKTYLMH